MVRDFLMHLYIFMWMFMPVTGGCFLAFVWRWKWPTVFEFVIYGAVLNVPWLAIMHLQSAQSVLSTLNWERLLAAVCCAVIGGILGFLVRPYVRMPEIPPPPT